MTVEEILYNLTQARLQLQEVLPPRQWHLLNALTTVADEIAHVEPMQPFAAYWMDIRTKQVWCSNRNEAGTYVRQIEYAQFQAMRPSALKEYFKFRDLTT